MPFGLHSTPATFQRLLDQVITPDIPPSPHAFAYLDDIVVCTTTFQEHLEVLTEVLQRLCDTRLRPNPEKCKFFQTELKYLGHIVDRHGLRTDPSKVVTIKDLTTSRNVKEARRSLGLISWYRRLIKDIAHVAAPLHRLLRKKEKWEWGEEQKRAFDNHKERLTTAPVLFCPDWNKPFTLQTDASQEGLGAALSQPGEQGEQIIVYASRFLSKT